VRELGAPGPVRHVVAPNAWSEDLDWVFFEGLPLANEVVFLHRPSRSLLLCDLAFNIGARLPWLTRAAFRLWGRYGSFGPTWFERLMIRDRAAARGSAVRILALDFERVVVAHGDVLERGGRREFERGFAWLLRGG
jgi:hypothetical protein